MTQFHWWEQAEVQADVFEAIKGGLIVKVLGLRTFLPAKLTAVGVDGNWAALVGEHIEVRILEANRRRNRVVVCQVPWKGELEDRGDE